MPKVGNSGNKLFPAHSFQNTFGVPTSGTAARQEPFDRYARVKNEALSGHVALREFPLGT